MSPRVVDATPQLNTVKRIPKRSRQGLKQVCKKFVTTDIPLCNYRRIFLVDVLVQVVRIDPPPIDHVPIFRSVAVAEFQVDPVQRLHVLEIHTCGSSRHQVVEDLSLRSTPFFDLLEPLLTWSAINDVAMMIRPSEMVMGPSISESLQNSRSQQQTAGYSDLWRPTTNLAAHATKALLGISS
jgi:hypothetical protein